MIPPSHANSGLTASTASSVLPAAAQVLGNTHLINIITSHVAEGDLLCWALACRAFHTEALLRSEGRITARAAFSPERLRWLVAGHVASVVEGSFRAGTQLQATDAAYVDLIVGYAIHRRRQELLLNLREYTLRGVEVERGRASRRSEQLIIVRVVAEALVAAMLAHGGSVEVQERACAALDGLARVNYYIDNQDSNPGPCCIAEAGGIEAVVAAMQAHVGSASVQERALAALGSLEHTSPSLYIFDDVPVVSNVQRAVGAGAVEAVVGAMQAQAHVQGSPGVQISACHLVTRLITFGVWDPANLYVNAEVIGAVVAAMRAHVSSADVQAAGCTALVHFLFRNHIQLDPAVGQPRPRPVSGGITNRLNQALAVEVGAVEVVVTAMRAHGGAACLQQKACYALRCLIIESPANQALAIEAGVVEAVVAAMRAHGDDGGVLEWAGRLLFGLACDSVANQVRVTEAGGIDALMAMRSPGGVDGVVAAMHEHGGSAWVQEQACAALGNLVSGSPDNQARAGEASAFEEVVAAMRAHEGSAGVQEQACRAISCLVSGSPDNQARAGEAGAVAAVIAVMSRTAAMLENANSPSFSLKMETMENSMRALSRLLDGSPAGLDFESAQADIRPLIQSLIDGARGRQGGDQ